MQVHAIFYTLLNERGLISKITWKLGRIRRLLRNWFGIPSLVTDTMTVCIHSCCKRDTHASAGKFTSSLNRWVEWNRSIELVWNNMEWTTTDANLFRCRFWPWSSEADSNATPRQLLPLSLNKNVHILFDHNLSGLNRGRWLQDVWSMLIPRLLRPGFWVMWEWRQQPAGMQLRVLAQILNLALVLLEWIWVLVQVCVGRQNMKTDVDGRREGGGTNWPEWTMG